MSSRTAKPILYGTLASILLLGVYFVAVGLISEPGFAREQFFTYWYFITGLAIGFGIQVGLFVYLKNLIKSGRGSGKVLGVTGAMSTATMISCCTHYLANLLPILGVVGVVTFVAQYQTELFWVGIIFNLGGIAYILNKILKFSTLGNSVTGVKNL